MAETIKQGSLKFSVGGVILDNDPITPTTVNLNAISYSGAYADAANGGGTTAIKVTQKHISDRTLAASGALTLDLTSGLTTKFGSAVVLTKLKYLIVFLFASPTGSALQVGPGASNGLAAPFDGAAYQVLTNGLGGNFRPWICPTAAGWTVDGTHKTLLFTNADAVNGLKFRLVIGGE